MIHESFYGFPTSLLFFLELYEMFVSRMCEWEIVWTVFWKQQKIHLHCMDNTKKYFADLDSIL